MSNWSVYIIQCDDGSLYTGISTDVERRFKQHIEGRGAKYFRAKRPKELIYTEVGHSRASASRRESVIKKLSRVQKMKLISGEDFKQIATRIKVEKS
ncbi:GIY-YIG nuclease family protein [Methylomonas sp. ZR1]|uniref:GIY-YIG nuclease family protein n=1 Tax=Methylomonas sp. ZR1 TaxID=1797072 RepID=UPI001491A39C|nr:GIY-YIG nuclease family protein [Methylomonas sp. ZR1]